MVVNQKHQGPSYKLRLTSRLALVSGVLTSVLDPECCHLRVILTRQLLWLMRLLTLQRTASLSANQRPGYWVTTNQRPGEIWSHGGRQLVARMKGLWGHEMKWRHLDVWNDPWGDDSRWSVLTASCPLIGQLVKTVFCSFGSTRSWKHFQDHHFYETGHL